MARIDAALVEAVDEFPTMFDFPIASAAAPASQKPEHASTVSPDEPTSFVNEKRAHTQLDLARSLPSEKPVDPTASPAYDEHSLAKAAEKVQWSARMLERGYVSKAQHAEYRKLYESLKARIEADIIRAQERVDWAKQMQKKGYLSNEQLEAEILKHYDALKARMEGPPINDELRARYDDLKRKYEGIPKDSNQPSNPLQKP